MKHAKSCLLIDEDHDEQLLFSMALTSLNKSIDFVASDNGFAALKKLEQDPGFKPDVIFMDLHLSGLNGIDCLTRIKANEQLAHIPVVIYSTSSRSEDILKAKDLGASAFITKPFLLCELIKQLSDFFLSNRETIVPE